MGITTAARTAPASQGGVAPCGLRVLHVIAGIASRYGGPTRAVLGMSETLQRLGVTTLIASTDADGAGRLAVELGQPVDYLGSRVVFFSRRWMESLKVAPGLGAWLDANVERFDVVHIHGAFSYSTMAAARACRRHGIPYIIRPLGSLDPWSLRRRRFAKRCLWYLALKRTFLGAAAIHYTTDDERRLAEGELGLSRGVVIGLGVDKAFGTDRGVGAGRLGIEPPYVLAIGRLHPKKGLELLIDAFAEATAVGRLHQWRLAIAGDGDARYLAALQRRAARSPVTPRIVFTGWVDGQERIRIIRDAALVALPSYQENFGLVAAEAMASGVPVLVSDRVNLARAIRRYRAGWVAPLDTEGFRRVLERALADEDERADRGRGAVSLARERFTWPRVGAELLQLYATIARRTT